ncbi:hypothetical protein BWP39_26415 [Paraburkholderia acidicola]|uniref:N-acetyltransferase domain-containing protein n=1 Tax=Paraburkholderia acidicola TaxID=1912599 RepID=A0A2A4ES07_9BURK|nr:hypothetical protein [Paraburkholderia acidicola]PCE23222.1 hypothetical protein BWP39_26415 [Paraburkholderia acidicola]
MAFIPDSFVPPRVHETPRVVLEILSTVHAVQDYECVMSCADAIRGVFGAGNDWPARDMTFAENLADLDRHEREFHDREAFAYAVFDKSKERCYAGCLYIKPVKSKIENDRRKALFDAQAFCWFSPVATDHEFPKVVAEELVQWVQTSWPFTAVAFPGRTIGWLEWNSMAGEDTR